MSLSNATETGAGFYPFQLCCGLRGRGNVYLDERRMRWRQTAPIRIHSRSVLQRCGTSIVHFEGRRQLLVAFRDAINGHWSMWQSMVLHGDVNLRNIFLEPLDIPDGWQGVLVDHDIAIGLSLDDNNAGVICRKGTCAFQSAQAVHGCDYALLGLPSYIQPLNKQRLMYYDYIDDLESFYYCLCWICFVYNGLNDKSDEENILLRRWQHDDTREAYESKTSFLEGPFKHRLVKQYFRDTALLELLEFLHAVFRKMLEHKTELIEAEITDARDLTVIMEEAEETYREVIAAFNDAIKHLGPEGMSAESKRKEPPGRFVIPSRKPSGALEPTTSLSLGNKRKASEESDEAPEKKKAVSTAPLIPSSLRYSESYDP